jgi:hypothetical protein
MDIFSLAIRITEQGADKVLNTLDTLDKKGKGTALSFSSMTGGISGFWAALAGGAAVAAIGKMISAASEAETTVVALRTAVGNAGGSFDQWSGAMEGSISKLMATTKFGDEDLRGALTNLINVSGNVAGSYKNLGVVADLAAAKHIDLSTASELVGKVMAGNTGILQRYGIVVKQGENAIDVMGKKFKGFAENEGNTIAGTFAKISNAGGEVLEAFGNAIIAGGGLSKTGGGLVSMLQGLQKWVENNSADIARFAEIAVDLGRVLGGALVNSVKILWAAFQGGQEVIIGTVAALETIPDRFRFAMGGLMRDVGSFLGGFAQLTDRILGTNLEELTNRWQDSGTKMQQAGAHNISLTKTYADQTIAELYKTADGASAAIASVGKGGPSKVVHDPAAEAKALNDRVEALSKLNELTKLSDAEKAETIRLEHGLLVALNSGTLSTTARITALEQLTKLEKIDVLNVVPGAVKIAAPDPSLIDIPITKVAAPLEVYVPSFVDDLLKGVQDQMDKVGPALGDVVGNTIGGFFEGGFKNAGDVALKGLGSILSTMGQSMLGAGLAMLKLLPALTNPFTSGPALIIAGATLLALGAVLRGTATGSGRGGGGGRVSGGGVAGGGDVTQKLVITPSSANATNTPLRPMIGNVTIIGRNDPKAQREVRELLGMGERRGL